MLRLDDLRSASWLAPIGAWLLCAVIAPVYFFWGGLIFGWLPFSVVLNEVILKVFSVKDEQRFPAFCSYLEEVSLYVAMGGWLVVWPSVVFWIYGVNEQIFIAERDFWMIVGALGVVVFLWFFANLVYLRVRASNDKTD